ncbi:hypothetical protein K6119_07605 [Paracrocinitomix mangrovi]|uniref:hypothetical protein n=1 Tax=Paracrocinitomix mangrovi TaxID=2862509 RepID=UPI001C8DC944|nr:hypothetical protein [Paracrocinitomix mangrovi]UKN03380.1 hypothetical protein K6119_07605 [Paracrocinitomix mangrovi]
MYPLETFFKDWLSAIKRVKTPIKIIIIFFQLTISFMTFMVLAFAFGFDIWGCLFGGVFIPGLLFWVPVLWKHWERTDGN